MKKIVAAIAAVTVLMLVGCSKSGNKIASEVMKETDQIADLAPFAFFGCMTAVKHSPQADKIPMFPIVAMQFCQSNAAGLANASREKKDGRKETFLRSCLVLYSSMVTRLDKTNKSEAVAVCEAGLKESEELLDK